jgi:2,3-bisphosphoglycerate-dependent phosphoglycerate mutase
MTPIRLILLRHGNTFEQGQTPTQVGARTDLPLTNQGSNQARDFAKYLSSRSITPTAIYAGSLQRQIATAHIISDHLQSKTIYPEKALTEIDYGPWEGLTTPQIKETWPAQYRAWTTEGRWPNFFGNSLAFHLEAINAWLDTLRSTYTQGETIVGVSSNGTIRLFYSLQEDLWHNVVATASVETLKVATGHFCELLLCKDSLQIKGWNLAVPPTFA